MAGFCKTPGLLAGGDAHKVALNLHKILDYSGPIPAPVVWRAAEDPSFLHRLIAHRKSPELIQALFEEPIPPEGLTAPSNRPLSVVRLASRFVRSVWSWLLSGGRRVSREVLEKRLAACAVCPNLTHAEGAVARAIRVLSNDRRTCALCGCSVACKARMATESCPDAHPLDSTKTRWGDERDEEE